MIEQAEKTIQEKFGHISADKQAQDIKLPAIKEEAAHLADALNAPHLAVAGEDQFDYNDVRAFVGVEWLGPRRVTGFVELGYVFEREILLRSDRTDVLTLRDSVMLRSGLAF